MGARSRTSDEGRTLGHTRYLFFFFVIVPVNAYVCMSIGAIGVCTESGSALTMRRPTAACSSSREIQSYRQCTHASTSVCKERQRTGRMAKSDISGQAGVFSSSSSERTPRLEEMRAVQCSGDCCALPFVCSCEFRSLSLWAVRCLCLQVCTPAM